MKFLKMFIALSGTCVQTFSDRHAFFAFLSHSVAVAALSGISHIARRELARSAHDSF